METLKARLEELKAAQEALKGVMMGQGYLVQIEGVSLAFVVNGIQVGKASPCKVEDATRFAMHDAKNVAKNVVNGNGEKGKAVHIVNALREAIRSLEETLVLLV